LLSALKPKQKLTFDLAEAQVWKTKAGYVRVGHVGKSLVQYSLVDVPRRRAARVRINTIKELQSYLRENRGVLV